MLHPSRLGALARLRPGAPNPSCVGALLGGVVVAAALLARSPAPASHPVVAQAPQPIQHPRVMFAPACQAAIGTGTCSRTERLTWRT